MPARRRCWAKGASGNGLSRPGSRSRGLGAPLLYYLAAGLGSLTVVDGDQVSEDNLNRQILYTETDLERRKVELVVERLRALNGAVRVRGVDAPFTEENGPAPDFDPDHSGTGQRIAMDKRQQIC